MTAAFWVLVGRQNVMNQTGPRVGAPFVFPIHSETTGFKAQEALRLGVCRQTTCAPDSQSSL